MGEQTELRSLDIPMPNGVADARLATPRGGEKYPGVLFFMDAFGVRPATDEWIQRIAAHGYVVLAPNLLYRSKRSPIVQDVKAETTPEKRGELFGRLMPMMKELTPENVAKDARAYLEFLKSLPETAPGPIGMTGYCMGGRFAINAAIALGDEVAAVASFHGGNLATDQLDSPHLKADQIKAEAYIGHADHDESASPEQQQRLDEALTNAGVPHRTEVYKDAPHGYTMSDTAAYREDAAEKHFQALVDLLDRRLKNKR